jgi:ABC-2 type transport system ATP-binding protein
VRETLDMFRGLYPAPVATDELVALCALRALLDRDTRRLSGGQRQRLLLALALINDPDILFLDEPTTGLDPQARRNFWDLVERIKEQHKTIVLTTHYMEEAYQLCDRVAIMDRGRIIAQDTPQRLLASHYNDVVLQLPTEALPPETRQIRATVLRCGGITEILTADVDATIRQLVQLDVPLHGLTIRPRTLEDLFLELTGKELRA